MEYINYIKAKTHATFAHKSEKPVISEEDEKFLTRIIADDGPRPFSPGTTVQYDHGGDAQIALMDGAQHVPLPPDTPDETPDQKILSESDTNPVKASAAIENKDAEPGKSKSSRATWSWLRRDSRDRRAADQRSTADSLHDIAEGLKVVDASADNDGAVIDAEAQQEEEDMTIVLEKLNLAAVNNRVFSISDETQDLLQAFNQVFKDLIKGVPTAYDDLESLLTNGDKQLQKTYDSLPPFLKRLIEKLPESMTKGIGPGVMAAAAEGTKPGSKWARAGSAAGVASKFFKTPNLKELVAKPSGIAAMLRSIMAFLRARFPAFFGMNVLVSLAMFVLLIVFWYCHKRGKEVRLEKERELTEQEILRLDVEWRAEHPGPHTTTAAIGAPIEEVQAGIRDVEEQQIVKAAVVANDTPTANSEKPAV